MFDECLSMESRCPFSRIAGQFFVFPQRHSSGTNHGMVYGTRRNK